MDVELPQPYVPYKRCTGGSCQGKGSPAARAQPRGGKDIDRELASMGVVRRRSRSYHRGGKEGPHGAHRPPTGAVLRLWTRLSDDTESANAHRR